MCGRIADRLARSVGLTRFDRYFQGCARLEMNGGALDVAVPSTFYAGWLDTRFGRSLLEAARTETGNDEMALRWKVDPEGFPGLSGLVPDRGEVEPPASTPDHCRAGALAPERAAARAPERFARNAAPLRHRLDEFVVGEANRLGFEAASRLGEPGADAGFSLLFLHGDCGVGKTHLLQGIAARYAQGRPKARVRCITGEAFTNDYITAVRAGRTDAFRAAYRRLDLLCIDDVHFLAGKTSTQSEFMHTFDALDLSGARVALASDHHPREIASLNQRLLSRCLAGMVVRLSTPDPVTRAAIVRRMAFQRGLHLEPGAAEILAAGAGGSVRDLEGALARGAAIARLLGEPGAAAGGSISAAAARRAIGPGVASSAPERPVRVPAIIEAVCACLGVEARDVLGSGRHRRLVLARGLIAHLSRRLTTHSYPEIAQALGRSNHSTVVTADQRFQKLIAANATVEARQGEPALPALDLCERIARMVRSAGAPQRATG